MLVIRIAGRFANKLVSKLAEVGGAKDNFRRLLLSIEEPLGLVRMSGIGGGVLRSSLWLMLVLTGLDDWAGEADDEDDADDVCSLLVGCFLPLLAVFCCSCTTGFM